MTTPKGFDMPLLLWVPRGYAARASAVSGDTLTGCGPVESFLSTGNSSDFCDHNGQLLSVHATSAKETGI